MVINCLLPYLPRFRRHVHFRGCYGQTAAIDASCWLHKALSVSFSQSRKYRERWGNLLNIAFHPVYDLCQAQAQAFFPGLGLFTRSYERLLCSMGYLCLQRETKMKAGEGEKISMIISLYNFWLFVVASHNKSYLLAFGFCLWGKKERKNRLRKVIECNTSPRGQQITQPGFLDHIFTH